MPALVLAFLLLVVWLPLTLVAVLAFATAVVIKVAGSILLYVAVIYGGVRLVDHYWQKGVRNIAPENPPQVIPPSVNHVE